jgi:putative glycosyltransferase (TIGR04348 family)
VTALRWAGILRSLGHRVIITNDYQDERCDLLIALHARKSADAVLRFRARHAASPLVVALTGTDVYHDLARFPVAKKALEAADRIVALQPLAARELEPRLRQKLHVMYQSAQPTRGLRRRSRQFFDVCVAAHMRPVKDPLRAAYAARLLPSDSRIRVLHAGRAVTATTSQKALAEQSRNPRYRWLGPVSRGRTRRLIARSRILVLSSRLEGGANVISEAVVDGTPVLASRIPGSVGLLGEDYPGYFPVGDTHALAQLLLRAETDAAFYRRLKTHCARLARTFQPSEERRRWGNLLREIAGRQTRK